MMPSSQFRLAAGLSLAVAVVLTVSSAQAQCRSSMGYRHLPPPTAVRTIAQPTSYPTRAQGVARKANAIQAPPSNLQNRTGRPVADAAQQRNPAPADLPILKPEQIRTVNNGTRMRVEVPTGQWKQGMGILAVQGTTMLIRPERWEDNSVTLQLPQFLLDKPVAAQLFIAANPETLLEKVEFQLIPGE